MVVRRTSTPPTPAAAPKGPAKAAARPQTAKPSALPGASKPAVRNFAQNVPVSDFRAGRAAPVSLDANVQRPFVQPSQGEWSLDAKGKPADPVTIYVHGSLDQVEAALGNAGWTKADPRTTANNLKYAGAAVKQEVYKALAKGASLVDRVEVGIGGAFGLKLHPWLKQEPKYVPGVDKMPVSTQTYRGQPLIAAFEQHNDPLGGRDHLRVFATGQKDAQGRDVYAIAASRDTGIVFAPDHPECAFLFHAVESDVRSERDHVLASLQQGGSVSGLQTTSASYAGKSVYGEVNGDGKRYELTLGG